MNIQRLLKFTKGQYEKVIKDLITMKKYDVHYSYTNSDVYLFGNDSVLDQIQLDSNKLLLN